MKLRQRIALGAALAVALSVALASLTAYLTVRSNLRGGIDASLVRPSRDFDGDHGPRGRGRTLQKAVSSKGAFIDGISAIPSNATTQSVAAGNTGAYFSDAKVQGIHLRLYTFQASPGIAIVRARSVDEIANSLGRLGLTLLGVTGGGLLLGAALGWFTSGRALTPVRLFTQKTEAVAGAGDLSQRLDVSSDDELGRLAKTFNSTLDSLEGSVASQRQLVADASHELRTPLASLKTNIEVLQRGDALAPKDRAELLQDVVTQTDELTNLVSDIVDIGGRGEGTEHFEDVRLDEVAEAAIVRVRRLAPQLEFVGEVEPWLVRGSPERLTRLVANLLDNATKWSPSGGRIDVRLVQGELSVRDHGPGIAPADLPHIFDRFYRSDTSRSMPGSGLGLAIVRQVARAHGADAVAANAEGGGTRVSVAFPQAP